MSNLNFNDYENEKIVFAGASFLMLGISGAFRSSEPVVSSSNADEMTTVKVEAMYPISLFLQHSYSNAHDPWYIPDPLFEVTTDGYI